MITITIKTENDAFQDGHRREEIARILRTTVDQIQHGTLRSKLFDINGNACGSVVVTGEDRKL